MKVLFVTSAYPSDAGDGRGIFIHRLAATLVDKGVEVSVVAPGLPGAPPREVMDGVLVERVDYWLGSGARVASGLGGIVPNVKSKPWLALQVPAMVARLAWAVRRKLRSVDAVHAHWLLPSGLAAVMAGADRRVPLLVTSHGGDLNLAATSRATTGVVRKVAQRATVCVGVSRDLCDSYRRMGVPERVIHEIPYGVDPAGLLASPRDDADLESFRSAPGLKVLYIGSLIPRKSVETLIDAVALLEARGVSLSTAIVGEGETRRRLEARAIELGLTHVAFYGPRPPTSVGIWMDSADAVVLPSLSEGRPNVVLEAMALGTPVVATRIPGTSDLLHGGEAGLLFPPGDAAELAARLEQLAADVGLRTRLQEAGPAVIEQDGLSAAAIGDRHVALYERAVEETGIA